MPEAVLLQHDFFKGPPDSLQGKTFDYIVCTYAIHHLENRQKAVFIQELTELLSEEGRVLIGDVAFDTQEELERCKEQSGEAWDEDEIYPVAKILKLAFPSMEFEKISYCAGVFTFFPGTRNEIL